MISTREDGVANNWWEYDRLKSRWPYDWGLATRGDRPWDQCDFHLDLGCGRVPKGRLGIDRCFSHGATDLVIDLETLLPAELPWAGSHNATVQHYTAVGHDDLPAIKPRLPFPDGSIESIVSNHALEHIGPGFERLMEECYRVLKWDGIMRIIVPLFPSYVALSEYDHKRVFMEGTLMGFCQELPGGASYTDGFSERYNTACFRMLDEDMTPPTKPEDRWTLDDRREIRTTLYKYSPLGTPQPVPADFIPMEVRPDADDGGIQDAQGDPGEGDTGAGGVAEDRGEARRSWNAAQGRRVDGDQEVQSRAGGDVLDERSDRRSAGVFVPQVVGGDPFASVCVLSYERLELLKECIGSMLATAEAPFELIVHDDGSRNPELRAWLVAMLEEGVISTLLMNSPGWNEGQGVAMNRMAAVAKGDPIIKCDQDLVFQPGWLRKVNEVLRENGTDSAEKIETCEPIIGALGLFRYFVDPVDHNKMFMADWGSFDEVQDFVGSLLIMPRRAWETFGPWGEYSAAFAEDALYKKAVTESEGWCCALTKEDLVVNNGFGIGPSTVVTAPGTVQQIKDRPRVYGG